LETLDAKIMAMEAEIEAVHRHIDIIEVDLLRENANAGRIV